MVKISEFLEQYGMNYTVAKRPSYTKVESEGGEARFDEVEGQFNLVRSTDGRVISPSTVSSRYVATNPQEMVAPLNPMISEGWISPESCHLFKEDSYEVVCFRIDGGQLDNDGNIMDEKWNHFLSIHNHQGGGGSLRGSIHSHRIICTNTAMRAAKMASFAIRHTGKIQENYEWAVGTWKKLQEEIREISKRMEVFADTKIGAKDALNLFQEIYGVKDAEKISTVTKNEIAFAFREFSNPLRGTRGETLADVYNAITATNSHYSPSNSKETSAKRLASLFDEQGSRNKLESVTMSKLLQLV